MFNIKYEAFKILTSLGFTTIINKLTTEYKPIIFLLVIMIIDTLIGHLQAIKTKTWNSSTARWGVISKAVEIIIIALLYLCEWTFNIPNIANVTIIYFIICEAASIAENIIKGHLNNYIPEDVINILDNMKKTVLSRIKKILKDIFGGDNNEHN